MNKFSNDECAFSKLWKIIPTNRSGLFQDQFNRNTDSHPIPIISNQVTLEDCIEDRIKSLVNTDSVVLMWSGGIDSTLVFYSLVDAGIPFLCVGNRFSVSEYPLLAQQIKSGRFNGVKWVERIDALKEGFLKGKTVLTGELGDQIIGSDILINKFLDYDLRKSQSEKIYNRSEWSTSYKIIDKKFNLKSPTVGEFSWAMNFLFKFAFVHNRLRTNMKINKDVKIIHFFDSDLFQQWSIQNFNETVHFKKIEDYKMQYKNYIYSINKDINYLKNKIKMPSCQITE